LPVADVRLYVGVTVSPARSRITILQSAAMGLWKRIFKGAGPDRVDYYREGLELLNVGKYHEALTSFRLALRETPSDAAVLQQMAIAYTRIGMTDEAAKTYRHVLETDPKVGSAHYGLAFLLLKDGRNDDAVTHLRAFLSTPPSGLEAKRHVEHARKTLAELEADGGESPTPGRAPPA
jgi:Flp pilus assembly protein TadD